MDKISLIAIVMGLTAIIAGQAIEGGSIGSLMQLTAFMIVIGGTTSAVMLQSTPKQFMAGCACCAGSSARPTSTTRK